MSDPPARKVGSLRDRIAAFEKPQAAAPAPPAPRPKPGGLSSWKPRSPSPPPTTNTTSQDAAAEAKRAGMSAADAKEAIGKGGSLKERMAALQGRGAFGAPAPPVAPKPATEKPKWKPPPPPVRSPTPVEDEEVSKVEKELGAEPSAEAQSPPSRKSTEEARPAKEDAPAEDEAEREAPTEGEAEEKEQSPEDEERERRAAIAARMARLGGARMGMGAPVFGRAPPKPEKKPEPAAAKPKEDEQSGEEAPKSPPTSPPIAARSPPVTSGRRQSQDYFGQEKQLQEKKDALSPGADTDMLSPGAGGALSPSLPDVRSPDGTLHADTLSPPIQSPPASMPLPAAPRRAGPPRRKAPKSPSPAPPPPPIEADVASAKPANEEVAKSAEEPLAKATEEGASTPALDEVMKDGQASQPTDDVAVSAAHEVSEPLAPASEDKPANEILRDGVVETPPSDEEREPVFDKQGDALDKQGDVEKEVGEVSKSADTNVSMAPGNALREAMLEERKSSVDEGKRKSSVDESKRKSSMEETKRKSTIDESQHQLSIHGEQHQEEDEFRPPSPDAPPPMSADIVEDRPPRSAIPGDDDYLREPELQENDLTSPTTLKPSPTTPKDARHFDEAAPLAAPVRSASPAEEPSTPPAAQEEPSAPADDEEEDEDARRKRVAARLAKMGGINPFAPPPPKRQDSSSSVAEPQSPAPRAIPPPRKASMASTTGSSQDSFESANDVPTVEDVYAAGVKSEREEALRETQDDSRAETPTGQVDAEDAEEKDVHVPPPRGDNAPRARLKDQEDLPPSPPVRRTTLPPPPPRKPSLPVHDEQDHRAQVLSHPSARRSDSPPLRSLSPEQEEEEEEEAPPPPARGPIHSPPRSVSPEQEEEQEEEAPPPPPRRASVQSAQFRKASVPSAPIPPTPAQEADEEFPEPPPRRTSIPLPHSQAPHRKMPPPPLQVEEDNSDEEDEDETDALALPTRPWTDVEKSPAPSEAPLYIPPRTGVVRDPSPGMLSPTSQKFLPQSPYTVSEVLDEDEGDPIDPAFLPSRRNSYAEPRPETVTPPVETSALPEEEDEEQARRRRIAERMAKLGGIKFGQAPPVPAPRAPPAAPSSVAAETEELPAEQQELTDEEEERARKERIAAKLANMGGMRFGMLPMGMGMPQQPSRALKDERDTSAQSASTPPSAERQTRAPPPPPAEETVSENESEGVKVEAEDSEPEEVHHEDAMEEAPPPIPSRVGGHPPRRTSQPPPVPGARPPVPQNPPPQRKSSVASVESKHTVRSVTQKPLPNEYVMVEEGENMKDEGEPAPAPPPRSHRPPPPRSAPLPPPESEQPSMSDSVLSQWEMTPSGVNLEFEQPPDLSLSWQEEKKQQPPAPVPELSPDELMAVWGRVGVQICEAATTLFDKSKKTLIGDGSFHGFIAATLHEVPNAQAVAPDAYGALVYVQAGPTVQKRVSEILPGDVVLLRDARLKGHKGLTAYTLAVGQGEDVVGIVGEFEAKKSKVRVFQANQHVGQQTVESVSYRLDDLKSGTIKVFRVLEA